jgi:Na+-driven multidrug efflux pump
LSLLRLFVFFVPISYLGSQLYSLEGMFWAGVLANGLTAIVAYIWFTKVIKKQLITHFPDHLPQEEST